MTAVVVVADPALLTEAISWSAIGLLGETLWLDRSDVRAGRSREAWQSVEATLLVPGAEQAQVPLQRHLAEPGDLGTIRVAWVRPADADDSPGLTSIASFALALLSHSVQASFMEVIVPEAIDSLPAIGAVVGNWRRVVVAPEDHASLTAPDAGYVNRSAPITVHAVAALTGRLGGEHPVPPPPRARSVEFVSVVSRHVGGACRATDRAVNHLDHVLPLSTARTIAPTRHELLSDRWLEVDRAADAVLAAADGSLVRIPSQPLDPAAGFLGERSPWYRQPWGPAFKAFLTGFDPEEETAAEQKERELMPGLKADIERAKRDAGQIPPPAVWSALTGLTLSLVDGGDCPGDFTPVIVHGRRAVVEPEYTLPRATDPLGSWPDGDSSLLPELKHRPPVEVARAAMEDVREQLGAGSRPLDAVGEPSSTKRLAVALAQRSKTQREAQQEVLAGVRERTAAASPSHEPLPQPPAATPSHEPRPQPPAASPSHEPLPLFDRIGKTILTNAISARLDAETARARAESGWPKPSWRLGLVRAVSGILVTLGLVCFLAWLGFGDDLNVWLTDLGIGPWQDAVVYAVGWALVAVALVAGYVQTLSIIRGRARYWPWRRQARLALKDEAIRSYGDTNRFSNGLRLWTSWREILLALLPLSEERAVAEPVRPATALPVGLAWTEPRLHLPYEEIVINSAGARPGYRTRILRSVAHDILADYGDAAPEDPLEALYSSDGYTESALRRVARDLPRGAWAEWRKAEIERIAGRVRAAIADPRTEVEGVQHSEMPLANYLGETSEEPAFEPGIDLVPADAHGGECRSVHRWSSHPPADAGIGVGVGGAGAGERGGVGGAGAGAGGRSVVAVGKAHPNSALYATAGALVIRVHQSWQDSAAGQTNQHHSKPPSTADLGH